MAVKTNQPDFTLLNEKNKSQLFAQTTYSANTSFQSPDGFVKAGLTNFELHPISTQFPVTVKSSFNKNGNDLPTGLKASEKTVIKPYNQSFKSRISIAPYFSKEFAGYNLSDDDATAADGREIEERERNVFSASVGINVNYRIKKRWVIQTGLSYSWSNSIIDSSKSFAVLGNDGIVQYKFNTISGYGFLQPLPYDSTQCGRQRIYGQCIQSTSLFNCSAGIIAMEFRLKDSHLLIGAGVSFNILTGATVETKIYGLNYQPG